MFELWVCFYMSVLKESTQEVIRRATFYFAANKKTVGIPSKAMASLDGRKWVFFLLRKMSMQDRMRSLVRWAPVLLHFPDEETEVTELKPTTCPA